MSEILIRDKFDPNDFDYYVSEYVRMSEEKGTPISHSKLRKEPYNLPDARWYIKNCPDKSVKRWAEFVDWCGFVANCKKPSKEKVISLIYKMQSELDRPLMYDDFRGKGCYHVGVEIVREYWGSINNMKEELGLEIIQESMLDRHLDKSEFDKQIEEICDYVKSNGRDFISTKEITSNKAWVNSDSLRRYAKEYYCLSLPEMFLKHGIRLGNPGRGISFTFLDGEKTSSQFEYMFSKYLRDNGFHFNINYFRNIKYTTFISNYSGNMDCDYVINVNDKTIYIEIAGVLSEYKKWYYDNKMINASKSKEQYRIKLMQKERMLKSQNLNYFILFPCDLTHENFKKILEHETTEIREEIEKFHQNNIDWIKIRKQGELDYNKPFIRNPYQKKKVAS